MKEEEEKTKKKPNWALQVSTLSDNKVWISLYLSRAIKALTILWWQIVCKNLPPPELVVNCVSGKIGRGRRRRGSWCRGGMRKRFDADMDYLFDCKISICANKYVCISTSLKNANKFNIYLYSLVSNGKTANRKKTDKRHPYWLRPESTGFLIRQ